MSCFCISIEPIVTFICTNASEIDSVEVDEHFCEVLQVVIRKYRQFYLI